VPGFGRGATLAQQNITVYHDPASDTGAHGKVDDVSLAARGAAACLCKRREIGIVAKKHTEPGTRLQLCSQRHLYPAWQVRSVEYHSRARVQGARGRNAETYNVVGFDPRSHLIDGGGEVADNDVWRGVSFGQASETVKDPRRPGDCRHAKLGSPQVNGDRYRLA
jgi:hypothetical protein